MCATFYRGQWLWAVETWELCVVDAPKMHESLDVVILLARMSLLSFVSSRLSFVVLEGFGFYIECYT